MKSTTIIIALIFMLSVLILDYDSDNAEAGQIMEVVGKDMIFSLPGSRVTHAFWILPGDNITVTLWNYSGPEGWSTVLDFGLSEYYERSDTFTSGLSASFNIATGRTYVFWAIVTVPGTMTLSLDMFDDGTSVSCEYNITRSSSDYSPGYFINELIQEAREEIDENMTSLQENVTILNNLTNNLTNQTSTILGNLTDLMEAYKILEDDVIELLVWRDTFRDDIRVLGMEIDEVNSSLTNLSISHDTLTSLIAALTTSYDQLNTIIISLTADVEALKASGVDLTWVEENLTSIRSQITVIETVLEGLPPMEEDITEVEALITQATQDIEDLIEDLSAVEASIPSPYNDTALFERIAQLEGQNELLLQQLADVEDEQDEIKNSTPSAAIAYAALALGLVALLIGVAAFMMIRKGQDKLWEESK
jgi:K+/H+ antiporter YhaU regulatory subunit KhtT